MNTTEDVFLSPLGKESYSSLAKEKNSDERLFETDRNPLESDVFTTWSENEEQTPTSTPISGFTEQIDESLVDRPTTNMTGFFLANDISEVSDSTTLVPEQNLSSNISKKLISVIEKGPEDILKQFKESNYDPTILKMISEVLEVCADRIDEMDSENSDLAKDSQNTEPIPLNYSKWISDFLTCGGLSIICGSLDFSELVSDKINKDRVPLEVHFLKCSQKLLDASDFSREFFLKDRDTLRALVLTLDCGSLELRAETLLLLTAILNIHIQDVDTHALMLENLLLFKKIKSESGRFNFLTKSLNGLASDHVEKQELIDGPSKQYILALMVFFNGLISKSPNEGIKSILVKELKLLGMLSSAKHIHLRYEEIIDDLDIDLGKEPIYWNILSQIGVFEKHFSKYYEDTTMKILEDVDTTNPVDISKSLSTYLSSLNNGSNHINNLFVNSLNTMLRLTKFGVIKGHTVDDISKSWKTIDRILKVAINEDKVTFTTETEIEQGKEIEKMREHILKLEHENSKLTNQKSQLEKKIKKQEQDLFKSKLEDEQESMVNSKKLEERVEELVTTADLPNEANVNVEAQKQYSQQPIQNPIPQPSHDLTPPPPGNDTIPTPPLAVPVPPGMGIPVPPGSGCPMPPAIGLVNQGALSGLPQLPQAKPSYSTKPIFLERILNTEVKNTIFVEKKIAENTNEILKKLDLESLTKTFQKSETKEIPKTATKPKVEEVKVVDQNRSYMISIQLKSIKKVNKDESDEMKFSRLRRGILEMDESFGSELVSCLYKCNPTVEEVSSVTTAAEELEKLPHNPMHIKVLGLVEKFIYEIRDIPIPNERISAWLFKFNLASSSMTIRNKLEIIVGACDQLQNSPSWLNLLSLVLAISNFLNTGNMKMQNLYGFKVSSITVLESMKSSDQKKTMIDVLCQICQENFPEIMKLQTELSFVSKCAPLNLFLVKEEIKQFKDEVDGVKKTCKLMESMKENGLLEASDRFLDVIGPNVELAETQIQKIDELLNQVEEILKKTQDLFGEKDIMKDENPKGNQSSSSSGEDGTDETFKKSKEESKEEKRTLVGIITKFVQNMNQTHVVVKERREKEMRDLRIQEKRRKKEVGSFFTNLKKLTVKLNTRNAFFGGLTDTTNKSKKPLSCMELIAEQTMQGSSSPDKVEEIVE